MLPGCEADIAIIYFIILGDTVAVSPLVNHQWVVPRTECLKSGGAVLQALFIPVENDLQVTGAGGADGEVAFCLCSKTDDQQAE